MSGIKLLLLAALFFWISPSATFAAVTPAIVQPADGSEVTDSSPKLIWSNSEPCPSGVSCYLIDVDNNQDFSSPEKDNIYTSNTNYTPQNLTEGNWFWRVKAKDVNGVWSEWALAAFTLVKKPPEAGSPVIQELSPSPSPSSAQGGVSRFTVQSSSNSLDVNSSSSVNISLFLPSYPNQVFYLKGAFIKRGGSNYFGKTKSGANWIPNNAGYSSQMEIRTDSSGEWSGTMEIMPDAYDSGYTGPGEYSFKVGRYSASGSGPNWSNELEFNLTGVAVSSPQSKSTAAPQSKVTASFTPTPKNSPLPVKSGQETSQQSTPAVSHQIASISGETSGSGVLALTDRETVGDLPGLNWYYLLSGVTLLAATAVGLILKYRVRLTFVQP